jgi:hypothetical protein
MVFGVVRRGSVVLDDTYSPSEELISPAPVVNNSMGSERHIPISFHAS